MLDITIHQKSKKWQEIIRLEEVTLGALQKAAEFSNLLPQDKEICCAVVFADDEFVQNLNKDYRQKNNPTNILSFANYNLLKGDVLAEEYECELGDLILAYEIIASEAKEQNKSFEHHLSHLLVHGFLHLLGYDHLVDKEAEEMEGQEILILKELGISNPYKL